MSNTEKKDFSDMPCPFLCVREGINGQFNSWADIKGAGYSVNSRDPVTNSTFLHYAAAYGLRNFLRQLIQEDDLDYLAVDSSGRLASQLAFEISGDIALGRLLMKKEMQQAVATDVEIYGPEAGRKLSGCTPL